MKYKTSYFNMAIIIEDLKRLWGLSVLYSLLIFFVGPLQILQRMDNPNINVRFIIERFLSIRGMEMQIVFSIAFSIILSLLVFRYLHSDKSTTVIHSLPITRKELYHSHNISGVILIVFPVLINAIFLAGFMAFNNDGSILFEEVFTLQNIGIWLGKTLLVNLTIYLISTLTAMVTGSTLIQGILSFVFIFLPFGLGTLMIENLDQLIYGFTTHTNIFEAFTIKIMPVIAVIGNTEITFPLVIWYLTLCIILYALGYYFYKNRHLERASDPITFDLLKPIFKYGVTFCAMVLGGAYFYSLERINIWLYIGYIIGGFLGYLIAEMLIKKTIWIFNLKSLKGFGIYTLIMITVIVGLKLDITGFERRVPNLSNIQNAYYGYGIYGYISGFEEGLDEKDNIEAIRRLHQQMIDRKKEFLNKTNNQETRTIGIVYRLKNGKNLARDYNVPIDFVYNNENIKHIYESEEYKRNYYSIFSLDISKIDYIELNPIANLNRNVKIIDSIEINEMIEALKKDILEETYEEYNSGLADWATMIFRFQESQQDSITMEQEKRIHASWKKNYDNLSNWLKTKGYYENARVMPEDIDYILIEKIDRKMGIHEIYKTMDTVGIGQGKNGIKIRDKDKVEYLLDNYQNIGSRSRDYIIGFYLKNGSSFIGSMAEENIPEELKNQLK